MDTWFKNAKSTPRSIIILVFPEKLWNTYLNKRASIWHKKKIPLFLKTSELHLIRFPQHASMRLLARQKGTVSPRASQALVLYLYLHFAITMHRCCRLESCACLKGQDLVLQHVNDLRHLNIMPGSLSGVFLDTVCCVCAVQCCQWSGGAPGSWFGLWCLGSVRPFPPLEESRTSWETQLMNVLPSWLCWLNVFS